MSKAGDGDKRSVTTDALATLGTIIGPGEKRDAIHLAVEPVVAGERLAPGDHISVEAGVASWAEVGQGLGIVDPFLTKDIRKGERFWFVMYPRQVHSLRHVWTHPSFPDVDQIAAPEVPAIAVSRSKEHAEGWLRQYADSLDVGFNDLIKSAGYWIDSDEYMVRGGLLEGVATSDEFWGYYEIYTGRLVPEDRKQNFFSCSC